MQGALSGLILGLAFSLWIGFGGPKPPIARLSRDVSGCSFANESISLLADLSNNYVNITTATSTSTALPTVAVQQYFPLYKLSYMWYAPLGFLVTVSIAQIVSRIVLKVQTRVGRSHHKIDPQLLSPCFPDCFRTRHHLKEPVVLVNLFFET